MLKYNLNNQYDNKTYTSVTDNLTNAVQYEEDREKLNADEVDKKDEEKTTVDEGNKVKPTVDECKLHPCCKYYYNLCFNDCYDSCCSNHDVAWFNTCDDGNTVMLNTTWDWEIELPGIIWYPEFFDFGYSELMLI
ncbi:hypothetical protein OUY_00190 [Wolbachia endosymbiont of Leptopilina clavipes]|uniref:hypothetical protein n=1 Tax=Wolbachia endosymbiont of Leptopilina clavipes TaxID=260213 RepID=UPI0011197FDB|nr:hypothetical protein [Wolbachia endosymbiont of Leptopilina clavipes]TNK94701.1 hypothetical protein OUY_00190 [Wolbachia endosymbiont of Leptopilina clavipes]